MKNRLVIYGSVIALAIIGFLGYLLIDTRNELSSTKNALNAKTDEMSALTLKPDKTDTATKQTTTEFNGMNDELAKIKSELSLTNNELNDTKNELNDTKNKLAATEMELITTKIGYNNLDTQITTLKTSFNDTNINLEEIKKELESANTTIEKLTKDISLYKEAFGEVYEGISPLSLIPDNSPPSYDVAIMPWEEPPAKRPVNLVNNPEAKNPSSQDLVDFLRSDITDKNRYLPEYYDNGNFAETVHNNAEAAGMRAAFVVVTFDKGPERALNAFFTPDITWRKFTYIDCTGSKK